MNRCVICQCELLGPVWLCATCASENGLVGVAQSLWPEWVRALYNLEHERRRYEDSIHEEWFEEIPISYLGKEDAAFIDNLLYSDGDYESFD